MTKQEIIEEVMDMLKDYEDGKITGVFFAVRRTHSVGTMDMGDMTRKGAEQAVIDHYAQPGL